MRGGLFFIFFAECGPAYHAMQVNPHLVLKSASKLCKGFFVRFAPACSRAFNSSAVHSTVVADIKRSTPNVEPMILFPIGGDLPNNIAL